MKGLSYTTLWNYLGILLIFSPFPLGLRSSQLSILTLCGLLILFINGSIAFGRSKYPYVLFLTLLVGTFISIFRGDNFYYFQFFRGAVFPLFLIVLLCARISDKFFLDLNKALPIILYGAVCSAFLYFLLESNYYNSTLDIPYEESLYKRFFVYPTYFFMMIFLFLVISENKIAVNYALLLLASGSKAIFISVFFCYIYNASRNISFKKILIGVALLSVLFAIIVQAGMLNRLEDFFEAGDPWRYYESLAAIERLGDPIRFLFGNGAGIAYWEGRESIYGFIDLTANSDESRVITNSLFDVHNGFLALALKFGVPLSLVYCYFIARSLNGVKGKRLYLIIIFLNILLSHGPVQIVEAVGLGLGIRFIAFRSKF